MKGYISDRSVALLLEPRPGHLDVGSGICVRIRDRYLVATVAHNLIDIRSDEQVQIIPLGATSATPLTFIARHAVRLKAGRKVDVAWVELRGEELERSGQKWVEMDQLKCFQEDDPKSTVFVQGYPAARVEIESRLNLESTGLLTLSIDAGDRSSEYQTGIDFAVEYPPHDGSWKEAPTPHGISGGGIWLKPESQNGNVPFPGKFSLVALSRCWDRRRKELRGTRIEHWLELVYEDFSDLRTVLEPALDV